MIELGLSDDFLRGYQDRIDGSPFDKNESEEWQMGWKNAELALRV